MRQILTGGTPTAMNSRSTERKRPDKPGKYQKEADIRDSEAALLFPSQLFMLGRCSECKRSWQAVFDASVIF